MILSFLWLIIFRIINNELKESTKSKKNNLEICKNYTGT